MKAPHYDPKYNINCLQKHTKPITSAPLYFPTHHTQPPTHYDCSVCRIVVQAFVRTLSVLPRNTEHIACASGVASVHLDSRPGERHPQWTECCLSTGTNQCCSACHVPKVTVYLVCHNYTLWHDYICRYANVESFRMSHCLGANLLPTSRKIFVLSHKCS